MLRMDERRLIVNLDDLRDYNREFCDGYAGQPFRASSYTNACGRARLLKNPSAYLPAFDAALKEVVVATHDPTKHAVATESSFFIGLRGSFGDHHVNPRTLRANMLGKMISVEGIVTRCQSCLLYSASLWLMQSLSRRSGAT